VDTRDPDQLHALCDALPDGVVIADADQRIVIANQVACRMLGDDDLVGRQLKELPLQDTDGRDWYAENHPYDGIGTRSGLTEQSWLVPDGTEVLVTGRLTRAGKGGDVELVALVLRSARGRARLDRERSDLVATVAHELRSPLTGVKGFVSTLLNRWEQLNDEQKKLMLTTVHADSERLSRLITELLDVARIDTGRLPLYPREVDLDVVVGRVLELCRAATMRTLEHDAATPGDAIVFADPDKLMQVVTNLVDNGIRHGEGVVRVRTERAGAVTVLTVDDEGDGIEEGIRARVFTKFWKHGARGGSGLGMYIVNGLVRVHGGDLTIGDAPGGGARLQVRWPVVDGRS
jgi:signal transduction histidine kinase